MSTITTTNPYTGKKLKEYTLFTNKKVDDILLKSQSVFNSWKSVSIENRTELLSNVADLLLENIDTYSKLITEEMGKPLSESIAEIEKCAWVCDFYVENAERFLADSLIDTDADESFISYDPLGCILAVMPWNYPFWQVMRFAAPTLTAGNTALLKHASNTTGCALAIEQLFKDAGYPLGCFKTLLVDHDQIKTIIENDVVKAVSLTGSEKAGKSIASIAAKSLKKTVLELGGNNACVVWSDADLDSYLETMVSARFQNTGQSCIAAKRFIVEEGIYDEFLERFTKKVENLSVGNPLEDNDDLGCMAREDLAKELEEQVKDSIDKGAKIHFGHKRDGAIYQPTIITEVTEDMKVFTEETFGPVAAIIKAKSRKKSLDLLANSRFGLGTMLFTESMDEARDAISDIPDGAFFVNDMVKSDPRLPFGGTKASGYGRELSIEGIMEFVNQKTVYIK